MLLQSITHSNELLIQYAAKVAKTPFRTPLGPDILCAAFNRSNGRIQATVSASDDKRMAHEDDEGDLFRPGR